MLVQEPLCNLLPSNPLYQEKYLLQKGKGVSIVEEYLIFIQLFAI